MNEAPIHNFRGIMDEAPIDNILGIMDGKARVQSIIKGKIWMRMRHPSIISQELWMTHPSITFWELLMGRVGCNLKSKGKYG